MPSTTLSKLDINNRYSYADYLLWQLEERVELIKGKIFKMSPAPGTEHQKVSRQLSLQIFQYFDKKECQAFSAPFDVRLPQKEVTADEETYTVVQPDLCVICSYEKLDEKGCLGAPDLIIEILSPGNSKKEMRDKYEVYEESGVGEYWLVNPSEKTVLIYVLNEERRFIGLQPLTEDQIARSVIFPELEINLKEVFNS
ncbi:MAG: Uma2 family endonuclease [Phaeodactylibacter sp.]|nr:Uma2 family endonuclease [Phaeodactylibacter sp.]